MKEKILKGGGVGGAVGTDLAHSRVQLGTEEGIGIFRTAVLGELSESAVVSTAFGRQGSLVQSQSRPLFYSSVYATFFGC